MNTSHDIEELRVDELLHIFTCLYEDYVVSKEDKNFRIQKTLHMGAHCHTITFIHRAVGGITLKKFFGMAVHTRSFININGFYHVGVYFKLV